MPQESEVVLGEVVGEPVCHRCGAPLATHYTDTVAVRNARTGESVRRTIVNLCPRSTIGLPLRTYALRPLPLLERQ